MKSNISDMIVEDVVAEEEQPETPVRGKYSVKILVTITPNIFYISEC